MHNSIHHTQLRKKQKTVKVEQATHKPTKIQFVQFDGKNGRDIVAWIKENGGEARNGGRWVKFTNAYTNQEFVVAVGDRVVKGAIEGDFYTIKPEAFDVSYKPVPAKR